MHALFNWAILTTKSADVQLWGKKNQSMRLLTRLWQEDDLCLFVNLMLIMVCAFPVPQALLKNYSNVSFRTRGDKSFMRNKMGKSQVKETELKTDKLQTFGKELFAKNDHITFPFTSTLNWYRENWCSWALLTSAHFLCHTAIPVESTSRD